MDQLAFCLDLIDLVILFLQLLLQGLLLCLNFCYLIVELVQFDLLTFDFLVVISQLFLPLFFLSFDLSQLLLCIEKIVFALAQVLFSNPALPLLVSLLIDQVFEVSMLVIELLLQLAVTTTDPVNFHLQLLTFICLILDIAFHLVDLLLALADLIFDFTHLLIEVCHCTLLQVDFPLGFLHLVLQTLQQHVLSLASVFACVSGLHLLLLIAAVLQLQLKQFFTLLSVELLSLAEVSNLNEEFLFVHLALDIVKHSDGDVIDHLKPFVDLCEHL